MSRLLIAVILCLFALPCDAGIREATIKFRNTITDETGQPHEVAGSGAFIARDGEILYGATCGHGFMGRIGGRFEIETWNHSKGAATLLDINKRTDVAIFWINMGQARDIDIIPIGDEPPDTSIPVTVAGHPGAGEYRETEGRFDTSHEYSVKDNPSETVYRFDLAGDMGGGSSGGPVVQNGRLVGIISAANHPRESWTASHTTVYKFFSKERTNCFGGTCRKVRVIQRGRIQPQPKQQPKHPAGREIEGKLVPKPDVPPPAEKEPEAVPPPKPEAATISQSDIDALVARIIALEQAAKTPGPAGDRGPRGDQGPAGAGADPKELAAVKQELAAAKQDLAAVKATKIPVVLYDGQGKVKSRKTVPLGQPIELKFSQVK